MKSRFRILERAAISVALFISASVSLAQKTETYRDIIEKSFNLSLQKDRAQSISLLINALKRETKKATGQKELLAALSRVSSVFYNDKTQQTYEIGISLMTSDVAAAQTKLLEASQSEPGNIVIDLALARSFLASGNCNQAEKAAEKQKELLDFNEELQLLKAQIQVCNTKSEEYRQLKEKFGTKRKDLEELLWGLLEVELQFKSSLYTEASQNLQNLIKKWPSYPEIHFWTFKVETDMKMKSLEAPRKYLSLCKSLSQRQMRDFAQDPWICRRTLEVENFLKKNNNSEI